MDRTLQFEIAWLKSLTKSYFVTVTILQNKIWLNLEANRYIVCVSSYFINSPMQNIVMH